MKNNLHLIVLSVSLTMLGMMIFLYKSFYLDFPLRPEANSQTWEVEIKISFETHGRPVKVDLQIPASTKKLAILNENFISHGFGLTTSKVEGQRIATWALRQPKGLQTLYYRALVEYRNTQDKIKTKTPQIIQSDFTGAKLLAAKALLDDAKQQSADMETFISELFKRFFDETQDENVKILLDNKNHERKKLNAIVGILALENIPARTIHGIELDDAMGSAELIHHVEVFDNLEWFSDKEQWLTFNIKSREFETVKNGLVFWRGSSKLINLTGGDQLTFEISKKPVQLNTSNVVGLRDDITSSEFWQFSLNSLPLATQNVYHVLLLVPIGTFILVLMRNIVGIKTFGTFMPVLIAISFRETHLLTGVILFTVLVALGLGIRFYLDRLKLLLVPRLSAVLIVVIILMLVVSIVSHQLGIESGLSIALFPMVIITMTIERMSIVWEERGPIEAIQQGMGSLLTATIAFLVMSINQLEYMITVFPELLLILLALTLLLGRYTGYRLTELRRFKSLVEKST